MHLGDSFSPSWGCFNADKLRDDKIYQRNGESLWYERDIYFTAGLLFPWGDISVFSLAEMLLQKPSVVRNGTKRHPGPCRLGAAGSPSPRLRCQAAWSGGLLRLLRKPLVPNTNSNITGRVRGFLKMHNFSSFPPYFFLFECKNRLCSFRIQRNQQSIWSFHKWGVLKCVLSLSSLAPISLLSFQEKIG